jgi:exodeoxyribonuclease VII large subunit
MDEWILEVSDLNEYVRQVLGSDPMLRKLRLRGEISNFKRHPSGHWYFTMKDERCRVACVMFRQNAMRMSVRPTDGMRVIVSGSVSLYPESGTYQFYAESMRPEGQGTLFQQFEALKMKLESQGLFDSSRKKPLPMRPKKIAVVTARTGAVLQDIRRVSAARDPGVPLVLLPVKVQGEGAAEEIARAIAKAGTLPEVDVIIVGRGGGSMEDLWAFNEEKVARAIAACPIPVISAVGHETDFTIADFVADARASTPSNAAEMAVPDREETMEAIALLKRHLYQQTESNIQRERIRLLRAVRQLEAQKPERRISDALQKLSSCETRLRRAMENRISAYAPKLALQQVRLDHAMDASIHRQQVRLDQAKTSLKAMDPQKVLGRGYAMVVNQEGKLISSVKAVGADPMALRFQDGNVTVKRVEEI